MIAQSGYLPTRNLQHQIADELRRLPEKNETTAHNSINKSKTEENKRVVIRKGRENYSAFLI